MDPALWELLTGDPQEEVAAVVRLRAGGPLPVGVRLVSRFGEVATCRLRRGDIPQVRHHPGVVSLKAPRRYTADIERMAFGGNDEPSAGDERRPAGESAAGRGVVVGVVDWGCDFAHADFRRPDGTTRLLALWDQRSGSTAARSPAPFGYGTVHTAADINRALTSADAYAALGYHPADSDVDGLGAHGTHVLGIAAGNGRAGGPVGGAPAAELVFVQFAAPRGDEAVWIGDSATLLEAIDFIARTAAGRPVVINLSLGRHAGSHDGTTLVEQAIDFFLAAAPGRAVIQSAGNYFSRDIHVAGRVRPGEVRSVVWETSPTDRTANELDIWYPGRDRLTIEIRDPGGHLAARVRPGERTAVKSGGRPVGRIYHRSGDPNNRDNQVEVFLDRSAPAGEWEVRVVGDDVADGRFHAWVERDAGCRGCQSQFAHADANPLSTTGSICNGFRTIAVGAYDPHDPNRALGRFSSAGPTRDGRTKPDLVAPGVDILAARSAPPGRFTATDRLTRMSGTSMAAPHVTGAVACVFEAAGRPLAVHETRAVLLSSCTPGEPTSAVEQARFGSGYLDLEQALTRARELGRSWTPAGTSAMARNRPPLESEANSHECGCQGRADRPRGRVASPFAETTGRTGSAYVRWLQSALNQVMASRLAVDGIIGQQTVQAVRAFQQRSGLVADGVVGSKTEAALIAAGAAPPPGSTPTPTPPGVAPPPGSAPGPRPPGGSVLAARPVAILDRFAFDQFTLTPQHREQVAHVATRIVASQQTAAPVHRVTLVGHTDNVGQAAYNRTLGQRRADAARQELAAAVERQRAGASQGVEFHSVSDGSDFPVAPNTTEDGRARNRRVEIFTDERKEAPPPQPLGSTEELKKKWFLDFGGGTSFPPVARHEGSAVQASTDGNLITPLIDGQAFMKVWHDGIKALTSAQSGELYHAAWRLEAVRTLGHTVPASDALELMKAAAVAGVAVFPMICRNLLTLAINSVSVGWLIANRVTNARLDSRFPVGGSNHQKFAVFKPTDGPFAILGSIDISKTRWDDDRHASINIDRDPRFGKPTHDTAVKINGPAVADIELTFRERWNDSSRDGRLWPPPPKPPGLQGPAGTPVPVPPLITTPVSSPPPAGTSSVQALHTYGRTSEFFGYSWWSTGEFTVWAAYLRAIQTAQTYIYIEDQYFLPFGYPPFCTSPTATVLERTTDIVFQLGEAIKRGVRVAVVVPSNAEDSTHVFQKYQRDLGYHYLTGVAATATGKFVMATLHNGTDPIYVHSKLMICDDEYLAIGSTNIGQRSMTYDGELHVGIVDGTTPVAKEYRKSLWAEHLARGPASLDDPVAGYTTFATDTAAKSGRVRPYEAGPPGAKPPRLHKKTITEIVDPYGGPPR